MVCGQWGHLLCPLPWAAKVKNMAFFALKETMFLDFAGRKGSNKREVLPK